MSARDLTEIARIGGLAYRRVAVLADDRIVAAGWREGPAVFDAEGELLLGQDAGSAPASDLDLAPDRRWAALVEERTGRILVTDGATLDVRATVPGAVAVGAREGEVAVVTRDQAIVIGLDGAERARFRLAHAGLDIAFAPGGEHLAVAHVEGVDVYTRGGTIVASLVGHDERVAQLVATPGALYSASWDGTVRRWGWSALSRTPAELSTEAGRWGLATPD